MEYGSAGRVVWFVVEVGGGGCGYGYEDARRRSRGKVAVVVSCGVSVGSPWSIWVLKSELLRRGLCGEMPGEFRVATMTSDGWSGR